MRRRRRHGFEQLVRAQQSWLRTLDAVHVITAIYLEPIDAFVTDDVRQTASARLAGLWTVAPGI